MSQTKLRGKVKSRSAGRVALNLLDFIVALPFSIAFRVALHPWMAMADALHTVGRTARLFFWLGRGESISDFEYTGIKTVALVGNKDEKKSRKPGYRVLGVLTYIVGPLLLPLVFVGSVLTSVYKSIASAWRSAWSRKKPSMIKAFVRPFKKVMPPEQYAGYDRSGISQHDFRSLSLEGRLLAFLGIKDDRYIYGFKALLALIVLGAAVSAIVAALIVSTGVGLPVLTAVMSFLTTKLAVLFPSVLLSASLSVQALWVGALGTLAIEMAVGLARYTLFGVGSVMDFVREKIRDAIRRRRLAREKAAFIEANKPLAGKVEKELELLKENYQPELKSQDTTSQVSTTHGGAPSNDDWPTFLSYMLSDENWQKESACGINKVLEGEKHENGKGYVSYTQKVVTDLPLDVAKQVIKRYELAMLQGDVSRSVFGRDLVEYCKNANKSESANSEVLPFLMGVIIDHARAFPLTDHSSIKEGGVFDGTFEILTRYYSKELKVKNKPLIEVLAELYGDIYHSKKQTLKVFVGVLTDKECTLAEMKAFEVSVRLKVTRYLRTEEVPTAMKAITDAIEILKKQQGDSKGAGQSGGAAMMKRFMSGNSLGDRVNDSEPKSFGKPNDPVVRRFASRVGGGVRAVPKSRVLDDQVNFEEPSQREGQTVQIPKSEGVELSSAGGKR